MNTRAVLIALVLLALGPRASANGSIWDYRDYKGADGGWVVFSLNTLPMSLSTVAGVQFRKVGGGGGGGFTWAASGVGSYSDLTAPLDEKSRDVLSRDPTAFLDGPFRTIVYAVRVPPGRYEIYSTNILTFVSNQAISQKFDKSTLPFEVRSGQTVYAGAIFLVPRRPPNSLRFFSGWSELLVDESDRDIAIAKTKSPGIGPVSRAEDLERLGLPQATPSS